MAADSIMGLFQDPQQYQQQMLQQQMKQNYEIAQLTPEQQVTGGLRTAGYQLGGGIGGLMGAEDPQMKLMTMRNQIIRSIDRNDPKSLAEGAQALNQAGDSQGAQALFQAAQARAKDLLEAEVKQSQITKNMREGNAATLTAEQRNAAALADSSGAQRGTQEWTDAYKSGLERLTTKDTTGNSEFERTLKGLNLTPEQEKAFKTQRLNALLNNDSSGIKAITAQLASLQLQTQQFKFDEEKKRTAAEKQTAITKLATVENDIDESLTTAAKALKLAPNSFLGAAGQEVGGVIPWTDQRALKNLVSSLNSDKAIGTLQELKTQSKTGATGFGALNTKELQLILDKTRALDPADKMFRENLTTVMNGWQKLKTQSAASRENLLGTAQQTPPALVKNPEAWIKKNLESNTGYNRDYVIRQGIEAGRLPKDYK
jgi:hypothetical protein